MLSTPDDLPESAVASALDYEWGVSVASMSYRPVGWGSHHWEAVDANHTTWFVTVDELEKKRNSLDETLDTAFAGLRASLGAAGALREHGHPYVVAPISTRSGEPVARLGDHFAVALYPYVDAESFEWGEFPTAEHRRGVLECVIAVHAAPPAVRRHAPIDTFAVPHRDEVEAALRGEDVGDCGPYADTTARLLAETAGPIRRLLDRYDRLVDDGRTGLTRLVLTHGEPHPGNTMRTPDGRWLLIDWDTALVAPPERDLWSLDPGDGSILTTYAASTGVQPLASMLELYRIRWDLADLAVDVSRFRRRHPGNVDDDTSWRILSSLVASISAE